MHGDEVVVDFVRVDVIEVVGVQCMALRRVNVWYVANVAPTIPRAAKHPHGGVGIDGCNVCRATGRRSAKVTVIDDA